ncbi:MAG: FMN-binding protein [Candidatus Saccharimonas sp.]
MKKVIVGIGVIGIFAVYSLGIRQQSPVINKPSSIASDSKSNSSSPPSSASPVGGSGDTPTPTQARTSQYKDGTYTGSSADAYYGNVQVSATISSGKLTDVKFLDYPSDHDTSVEINSQAMPYLKQEAVRAQSSNVQVVSGATFTSKAFVQSLGAALLQAEA